MFTNRFVKLPIKTYNTETENLTGKLGELTDSWTILLPTEIMEYRPGSDIEKHGDYVNITLRNGTDYNVHLTMKDFENLLNKY